MSDTTVILNFRHSRSTDGQDVAAILRRSLPEADVTALLDDAGAVEGYDLTLHFDDPDRAADVAFKLRDWFSEQGWAIEVS